MITYKTEQEFNTMRYAGANLNSIFLFLSKELDSFKHGLEIDYFVEDKIRELGGDPIFKGYQGFPASCCISINDLAFHGVPSTTMFREGDVISIDIGLSMEGLCVDSSRTYIYIKPKSQKDLDLIFISIKILNKAIEKIQIGKQIGIVSHTIEKEVFKRGLDVVKEFTGHGIGYNLHESPTVYNYGDARSGVNIIQGMAFCIEPCITRGNAKIRRSGDWGVYIDDGSTSVHIEDTIIISEKGIQNITEGAYINQACIDYIAKTRR